MIPEKAARVRFAFLIVYFIFGVIIIYLFMFNSGLAITEDFDAENSSKIVYVENTTDRAINNVSLKYMEAPGTAEKDLNFFPRLLPHERKRVFFDDVSSQSIVLVLESPFHSTIEKTVVLQAQSDVAVKLNFPDGIGFGKSFSFAVEACNNKKEEAQVKIEETHEKGFFSEPNRTDVVTIAAGECRAVSYSLLPVQKGETTINFNVNIANTIKQFGQRVSVE
ncbi:MAG TPA: hypothetical protein VFF09_00450 [archaeon]|nr:hypothetical protein [archaeon]